MTRFVELCAAIDAAGKRTEAENRAATKFGAELLDAFRDYLGADAKHIFFVASRDAYDSPVPSTESVKRDPDGHYLALYTIALAPEPTAKPTWFTTRPWRFRSAGPEAYVVFPFGEDEAFRIASSTGGEDERDRMFSEIVTRLRLAIDEAR